MTGTVTLDGVPNTEPVTIEIRDAVAGDLAASIGSVTNTFNGGKLRAGDYLIHVVVPPGIVPVPDIPVRLVCDELMTIQIALVREPTFPLTVTLAGTGSGTVTSAPAGIDCGADCTEPYTGGTAVTLTAAPDAASVFDGWSGACAGTGACVVTMDAAKSVTATFTPTSTGSISDVVWQDLNGNGIQEAGEPGLAGVSVTLLDATGAVVGVPTATNPTGNYTFTGLAPGSYQVRFVAPGWGFTLKDAGADNVDSDADPATGVTDLFALAPGATDTSRDAGLVQANTTTTKTGTATTTVGGQITYTLTVTNNGPTAARNVRTTDVLPAGTTYVSSSAGCDAVNGTVTCTTGSLGNGETATYTIVVTVNTPGTKTNTSTTTSDTPDPSGGDNSSSTTTTVENRPPTITVPADITVVASSSAGAVVTYTVTASDPDGDAVTISCAPASGSTFAIGTTTTTCTATDTHGASASASFAVIVVNNPPWITTPASITVNATSSSGAVVTYSVTAGDPDGHAVTTACAPSSGSTFPIGTTTVACTVTDIIGASATASFSVTVRSADASISDYVWQDLNGNGIQELGEPGLAGVSVTLLDATGAVVGVPTATNPTGHYLFTGLAPGSYQVRFVAPGWGFTLKDAGADNVDSDADPSTGVTDLFALAPGATDTSRDAGLVQADTTTTKIGPATTTVGASITYTLTVRNNGPTTARNLRTTDVLPAGTTYVSSSVGCDAVNGTVTCTTASLGNGETATYTIAVTTTTSGTIANTGTTTSTTPDPNGGDNSSSTTTTVRQRYDLTIGPLLGTGLTGTPDSNSEFAGWSGACTGTGACTITMDAAKTVTATFVRRAVTLTVNRLGTGGGVVASDPVGIFCGAACAATFDSGTVVTLTATPDATSSFAGWSGACTGTGACSVTMDAAKSVTATFITNQHPLTVTVAGSGGGTVTSTPAGIDCGATCTATYDQGTGVTLTATPDANSEFAGWSGACTGTGACTVTVDAAKTVTATFVRRTVVLTVTRLGTGGGVITSDPVGLTCDLLGGCAGTFDAGTQVILTGTP
ncbi:MAG: hypothetical protein FD127_3459, partial [Acidimicrobiaceae bacterium]